MNETERKAYLEQFNRRTHVLGRIVSAITLVLLSLIHIYGESIILRKYQPACIFCDNAKDIINYKGKNICPDCIRAMNEKL